MDVNRFFGMRFGICGGNFEVVWWESLAYLLELWGGLFVGLVFVFAMGGAIIFCSVWVKQLIAKIQSWPENLLK